jgi:hypothetical protein
LVAGSEEQDLRLETRAEEPRADQLAAVHTIGVCM